MSNQSDSNDYTGPLRVVILGGGYGGVYTALKLQKAARKGRIRLTMISRDNFFLFQPMLAEAISGSIEPTHVVNPVRKLIKHGDFYQAEIEAIDTENRQVTIRYTGDHAHFHYIPYDHLVIAVGSRIDLSRFPGMSEHAFPFQTLGDAFNLRNHLIGVLEAAEVETDPDQKRETLTFVVAGGGYTGVEVAAEINEFIREASKSYRHIEPDETNVILLQANGRILPELNEAQAQFSQRILERRGIEVRLNTRLNGATAESAVLGDGSEIPTRTLVSAIGAAPNPLLAAIPAERDRRGRLATDENLAVKGLPNVWAVGDCAAIPDIRTGGTCPPTAQFTLREARHLAKNILASIAGQPLRPFSYRSLGVFVPLGRFSAAAEVMGVKVSGFPAWWLYRTYYLWQLPRIERKLRVVIDWTLDLLFRGDIVHWELDSKQSVTRAHYESGDVIFRQGEIARNFYILARGEVQIFRSQDGKEEEVVVRKGGEHFGEMALLRGGLRTASARALTPVDALVMKGTDFTALAAASTYFSRMLSNSMQELIVGADLSDLPKAGRASMGERASRDS